MVKKTFKEKVMEKLHPQDKDSIYLSYKKAKQKLDSLSEELTILNARIYKYKHG